MDYKPIIDKAQEFIGFYVKIQAEVLGKVHSCTELNVRRGLTTRNHLVYSWDYGFRLNTPIGVIELPGRVSIRDSELLNERLIETFGMIEIMPAYRKENGNCMPATYCIPLDPKQPNLDLPPPSHSTDIIDSYQARLSVVYRISEDLLYYSYFKLITGENVWRLSGVEKLFCKSIVDQYEAWREETSTVDDTIPFTDQTAESLRREFGFLLTQPQVHFVDLSAF